LILAHEFDSPWQDSARIQEKRASAQPNVVGQGIED